MTTTALDDLHLHLQQGREALPWTAGDAEDDAEVWPTPEESRGEVAPQVGG